MKRIDKMVRQAKKMSKRMINPVHIIEEGYCSSCQGECRYIDVDDVVVINIDIPRGGGVDESEKEG